MNEEQIEKLNQYLNDIFLMLEEKDSYLLHNTRKFVFANEFYAQFANNLDFEKEETSSYLTFEEVYALGREIIESICPCYLEEYNQILSNGILDFSYENEYDGSHFHYNLSKQLFEININRQFTYQDVVILIHEFMHDTNGKKVDSEIRHLLTEFISIYFETKAIIYLMEEKGVSPKEIPWNERLKMIKKSANTYNRYSFPLTMYLQFGKIDLQYISKLEHYLSPFTTNQNIFTAECITLLSNMEKLEKTYCKDYSEEKRNQDNWLEYIKEHSPFADNYRYLLGTILAFYALDHCEVSDIIKLNHSISNYKENDYEDNEYGEIENLLCNIGIDINNRKTLTDSIDGMRHFVEIYGKSKRR